MFLVQHILLNTFNSKVYSRPQHGTQSVRESVIKQIHKQYIIIIYMQFYTLIFCSIISVTYQVFIIINCSSRLVQCLRILDVNRKVEWGRAWSKGGREGGSVGG